MAFYFKVIEFDKPKKFVLKYFDFLFGFHDYGKWNEYENDFKIMINV